MHLGELNDFQKEITNNLEKLSNKHTSVIHLSAMPPVRRLELEKWLMELGDRNPSRLEAIIDTLVKGLQGEDLKQYKEEKLFNMDDIERLQEIVVNIAQSKY